MQRQISTLLCKIGRPLLSKLSGFSEPDVVIILGTTVNKDGSPSFGLLKRVQKGIMLANEISAKKIILSGGRRFGERTEAEVMLEIINNMFPNHYDDEIILERFSRNTIENAKYSTKIMKELGFTKGLVITSPYHVDRAFREFNRFSAKISIVPAFNPSEYPLQSHIRALLHEYLVRLFTGLII